MIQGDIEDLPYTFASDRFQEHLTMRERWDLFSVGAFSGFLAGVLGISGSIVAIPLQVMSGVPIFKAIHNTSLVAVSCCFVAVLAHFCTPEYTSRLLIDFHAMRIDDSILLCAAGAVGAHLGVVWGASLVHKRLHRTLGELYVAVGAVLVLNEVVLRALLFT
jgi:uncharacterized membrane protein YfcA